MSTPYISRVRRKPAPSIDARYPAPDPDDPFAPLWVLRSRSSNGALALAPTVQTLRGRKPSYDIYPTFLEKQSHYRRRSQSTPPGQLAQGQLTVAFPVIKSNIYEKTDHAVPSLLTDDSSSTDVDPIPVPATTKPWPSSPIRLARLLVSKRKPPSKPPVRMLRISSPLYTASPDRIRVQSELPRPEPRKPTTSFSSSSFVHISISSTYSDDDTHAYTSPRPAPSPVIPKPIPTSASMPLPPTQPPAHRTRHPHSLSVSHITRPAHPPPPAVHAKPEPEWSHPTPAQLARAAALPVVAASGLRVPFGALFAARRTVVVFVRHFWCPLCQDYITSIAETAHPGLMLVESEDEDSGKGLKTKEQVDLVVISNGAPAFIPKYKQLFGLPFELYTDPSLAVYAALGIGRVPFTSTPPAQCAQGPAACTAPGVHDGGYVRHGTVGGIAMVVLRALKAGLPVWEKGGDIHQLGGEFVLGPGLVCTYAHRMQSPKGHAPIRDVLTAAGIRLPSPTPPRSPPPPPTPPSALAHAPTRPASTQRRSSTSTAMKEFGAWRRRSSVDGSTMATARTEGGVARWARHRASVTVMGPDEEAAWMHERMRSLERLRARKSERRGWEGAPGGGTQSEGGHCSPVREESDGGRGVGDFGEVVVIGFEGGVGLAAEGQHLDDDEGLEVSPTGATEDSGEREAG